MLEDFLYISHRKVDNYAPQVPRGLANQLAAEVSASLGLISTKLSTKDQHQDRVSRMLLVKKFIEDQYDLGTTEHPGSWVKDELLVQNIRLKDNPDVFLLLGTKATDEICALAGSSRHITGNSQSEFLNANASFFADFAELITHDLEWWDIRDAELDMYYKLYPYFTQRNTFNGGVADEEVCVILDILLSEARGRKFQVQFLAIPNM